MHAPTPTPALSAPRFPVGIHPMRPFFKLALIPEGSCKLQYPDLAHGTRWYNKLMSYLLLPTFSRGMADEAMMMLC